MIAPLIRLRGLQKHYGKGDTLVRALDGVDLDLDDGGFVAIMGASGSGKSTCMNVLGCLDIPTAGSFLFRGVEVGNLSADERALLRRHHIGFVFQGFNLLTRTTALENVELPLLYQGVPSGERRRLALLALDQVGLANRASHTPNELSGGQQQRVAIARAIVSKPSLILADEPTGNLDSQRSDEVMKTLRALNTDTHITIIMVTHEPDMAELTDRIVVFRDGKIVEDAPTARASQRPDRSAS